MAVYVLGLGHPNATLIQIWGATAEGYCWVLKPAAKQGRGVASSRSYKFLFPHFFFFFLLLTCPLFTEKQHPGRAAMRARDGLSNFCRPPPPGCSLITFFIAVNLKFRFAALPLLTMTFVACCRGDRMLALFWCGNSANWGQTENLYQVLHSPVGAVFFFFLSFCTSLFGSAHGGCELS